MTIERNLNIKIGIGAINESALTRVRVVKDNDLLVKLITDIMLSHLAQFGFYNRRPIQIIDHFVMKDNVNAYFFLIDGDLYPISLDFTLQNMAL